MTFGRGLPFERALAPSSAAAPSPDGPDIDESYELAGLWPGTVPLPSPVWGGAADIDESYELAGLWPGTVPLPSPVWGGAADIDESYESAGGWPV